MNKINKKNSCVLLLLTFLIMGSMLSMKNTDQFIEKSVNVHKKQSYSIHFCPQSNCTNIFQKFIKSANSSLYCALYDSSEENLNIFQKMSKKVKLELVVEKDNLNCKNNYTSCDKNRAYMHNKFCIVDQKRVLTGSTNPTLNGLTKNNNDIIIIQSESIADVYLAEFEELKDGVKQVKTKTKHDLEMQIYFCPEDNCVKHLIGNLKSANHSIKFAAFSFTDQRIFTQLILAKQRGVSVTGIVEARSFTKYLDKLLFHNITLVRDKNKNTMHHKFFIIDNKIVWTGSYNPTNNGDKNNDENIILIKNKNVAKRYSEYFNYLYELFK